VQSLFHNWMSRRAWVMKNGESILLNEYEMVSSHVVSFKIEGGWELFYTLSRRSIGSYPAVFSASFEEMFCIFIST
jgi:hypothetical protein